MVRWSKSKQRTKRPSLPEGIRVYAMTDIHGCADQLERMFTVIDRDLSTANSIRPIHVFLGDYIDRGPASRETIELLARRSQHHETIFLKGNHEAFLLEVLNDPSQFSNWKQFGGIQTLISYGLRPPLNPDAKQQLELIEELRAKIPAYQLAFLNALRARFVCGDFFFVHAGVRPGVALAQQQEQDLLWIREEFLVHEKNFEKYIVHGHTPVQTPDIRSNRANIDTGAYATGNLTLLTIQGDSMLAI
ncbi:serine/threonine protein phosphatase [Bradyrhizobium manausense]|uniref:metallophosphoesterase family protein n=1 Tax=Bradyrhizobium manausense TaxID=989370 RepID=UPI001BAA6A07|nr:metallophosphoesterase family protein [Bradyrhizobium manausense]MBR1092305.1 serine/threonine protein phosphatase [Bradyrhizobium manausense]